MIDRLIFLDFDGVLNRVDPKGFLIRNIDWLHRLPGDQLETSLVHRVASLATNLDAQVVLSTSWRETHTMPDLIGILGRHGFPADRILGKTPRRAVRGQEIAAFLNQHPRAARLAVLDDNDRGQFDMTAVRPWLVHTDPAHGLTRGDASEASRLLIHGPVWSDPRPADVYQPSLDMRV
jgi:hypothetical protein